MALTFNRLVRNDLRVILRYYESLGGMPLADRFFAELEALISQVGERPTSFHPVAEGLRRANLPNFPYHLLFRERIGSVRVLVIRHHRKHPDYEIHRV